MPDGHHDDGEEQLPRDGVHFCKRARSTRPLTERRIDIYRFDAAKRQTVKVGTTDTSDIGKAALALKRFMVASIEAQLAERKAHGKPQPKDMLLFEVFGAFLLAKEVQWGKQSAHELDEMKRVLESLTDGPSAALADVVPRIGNRSPQKRLKNFHGAIEDARKVWPDNPLVSTLDLDEQTRFVDVCRELGRADSTIRTRLTNVWTMIHWAKRKNLLVGYPPKITTEEWQPSRAARRAKKRYKLEDLAGMLNYAAETNDEVAWRGLNIQLPTGCRTNTAAYMIWLQRDTEEKRLYLNPPARRETKKRRPALPLPPTLDAEMHRWEMSSNRHSFYMVTQAGVRGDYAEAFARVSTASGAGGTPMDIRRFLRTWLYEHPDVKEKQANLWIGHADLETSDTSRRFYIMSATDYLDSCVIAVEALYDALQPLVHYPLGHRLPSAKPEKTQWMRGIPELRGKRANCVADRLSNLLTVNEITHAE